MPTKYSSRCLKKNKNNLDIVVRRLLWKLEGLFSIVNMIHMSSHNETINLHIKVGIVPALYMCYTLKLLNGMVETEEVSPGWRKYSLMTIALESTGDTLLSLWNELMVYWIENVFTCMFIWNTTCVPELFVLIMNILHARLCWIL